VDACGVMTSDDMGPKGPGAGIEPDRGAIGDIADEATSVIEISGAIKWFDVSKGYGFIVPDNGLPDVLLHVTCLRRDGFQVAYEGARIVV
jgi:cold shock protein